MKRDDSQLDDVPGLIGPVAEPQRIWSLDVLRGFALLGILIPNIQAYSMILMAYRNPTAYGDFSGANFLVWYGTNLFFEQKFMTLFSLLFGAGIIVMTRRVSQSGRAAWRYHYRRMLWLLLFGMLHAYLLWFGDILFCYAVSGMVVFWFRNFKSSWLLCLGLLTIAVGSAISLLFGWSMNFWPPEQLAEMRSQWQPPPDVIQAELDAYRGGWIDQMPYRATSALMFETFLLAFFAFWRAAGLMLMGMALLKLGIISGERSNRFYGIVAVLGLGIGLPLVAVENQFNLSRNFAMEYSFFFGNQINYWASLLVSSAYLSIIMLVCRSGVVQWLQNSLAAVGRMAFTNYIAHSVICTTIFYGHGLGYFGYLERIEQFAVVLSIWIVQLVVSPIWLRYFRFGPLEWLWRSLSYWKWQPMRLHTASSP